MNLSRRDFLTASSAAALWTAGGCCHFAGKGGLAVNGVRIGVQMWSVNDLWKKDPAGAFRKLKALGWAPEIPFETTLRDIYNNWLERLQ